MCLGGEDSEEAITNAFAELEHAMPRAACIPLKHLVRLVVCSFFSCNFMHRINQIVIENYRFSASETKQSSVLNFYCHRFGCIIINVPDNSVVDVWC